MVDSQLASPGRAFDEGSPPPGQWGYHPFSVPYCSSHLTKSNYFPDFQAHGVGFWCTRDCRFCFKRAMTVLSGDSLGVAGAIESSSADQSTPSTRRGTRHHVRLVAGHGRRHHRDPLRRHSRVGRVVSRVRFLAGLLCQS